MRLLIFHGGSFSDNFKKENDWENQRSTIHHDEFHHRFYQYFGGQGSNAENIAIKGIDAVRLGETLDLPVSTKKAFENWPKISTNLHNLFARAPTEGFADDEFVLVRLAQASIETSEFPLDLAQLLRVEIDGILVRRVEINRERIVAAIAEPTRLLECIDDFILGLSGTSSISSPAAKIVCVDTFLEWCRQLDRALSDIPQILSKGIANARS